ncbi:hypothetical protein HYPSUDRAFT_34146 [Hypholoma sublateritium FD-334 SS-4]|uniref:Uncharacterized protein n=1 Tax=Hypholoma sublateritium (strain FD-334 SS-4) TaxID=945553 RepID=A0A0D2PAI2_HYPSF|nr:hypothetical protein HYPSUDRAFT_34146 [Hypholoma sublateritium FD-334 SS-4]
MPFNTKTTTKSVAPFKPTAHVSNTVKVSPHSRKQGAPLKVDVVKAPVDSEQQLSANQSDEENVRPSKDTNEPLSPLDIAAAAIPKVQERDMRAYEHDRQRTKRAGERALNRARKAAATGFLGPAGKRAPSGGREDRDAKRKLRGKLEVEIDAGVDAVDRAASPIRAAMLIEGLSAAGPGACVGAIARANARAVQSVGDRMDVQVSFAELLEVSQRKPRKGKEDEFELVPAVRGVIVLDDMPTHVVHDMEIDEPWEHIESEESEGKTSKGAEPSYAQVVVRA